MCQKYKGNRMSQTYSQDKMNDIANRIEFKVDRNASHVWSEGAEVRELFDAFLSHPTYVSVLCNPVLIQLQKKSDTVVFMEAANLNAVMNVYCTNPQSRAELIGSLLSFYNQKLDHSYKNAPADVRNHFAPVAAKIIESMDLAPSPYPYVEFSDYVIDYAKENLVDKKMYPTIPNFDVGNLVLIKESGEAGRVTRCFFDLSEGKYGYSVGHISSLVWEAGLELWTPKPDEVCLLVTRGNCTIKKFNSALPYEEWLPLSDLFINYVETLVPEASL